MFILNSTNSVEATGHLGILQSSFRKQRHPHPLEAKGEKNTIAIYFDIDKDKTEDSYTNSGAREMHSNNYKL